MRPALAAALVVAAGCAAAPRQPPPPPAPFGAPEVRAVRVHETIIVDGVDNDAAWRDAPETEVPLEGKGPATCRVKTAVYRGTIFFCLRWKDPTESRSPPPPHFMSGPWESFRAFFMADLVGLTFPILGPFPEEPDPSIACTMDYWEWESGMQGRTGRALDFLLANSDVGFEGHDWARYSSHLWMHMDEGKRLGSGSIADVTALGRWRDGEWAVEFARALSTGHADDRDFCGLREIPFRLSIHDRDFGLDRGFPICATSPVLRLLLPPPEDARQAPLPEPLGPPAGGR